MPTAVLTVGQWLDTVFHGFDYSVFQFFSKLHMEWLTPIIRVFTEIGDAHFVVPMMLLGFILCFSKKTRKVGMTLFFAIVIGTLITNLIAKPLIDRARPYVSLADDPLFMGWYTEVGALIESDKSFPSGHTTAAFEMAIALFMTIGSKKIKWVFPVAAVLVGATRLYLMVHYCTDVLGGMLVGIFAGILGYFVAKSIMFWLENSNLRLLKWVNNIDIPNQIKGRKNSAEADSEAEQHG